MNRALLVVFFLFSGLSFAIAEGSKTLTPNQTSGDSDTGTNDHIGYLMHGDEDANSLFLKRGAADDQKLFITLLPGETIYYGIQRLNQIPGYNFTNDRWEYPNTRIQLWYNQGGGDVLAQGTVLTVQDYFTIPFPAQTGVIEDADQAYNGPNRTGVTNGYDAVSWTNTTGQQIEVWVEISNTFDTDASSTTDLVDYWNGSGNNLRATYDLWDFTVIDADGIEREGRMYAKEWSFSTENFAYRLSRFFSFYTLIPSDISGYYVKKVNYEGMMPFDVVFTANSTGTGASGDYMEKRRSQNSNDATLISPEYNMYLNDPDEALFPSSPTRSITAVATNSFCNNSGQGQMIMNIQTVQDGVGLIWIDVNQDEIFDSSDRLLEQQITAGNNYFLWDGMDGAGTPVPSGTQLRLEFRSNVKAVHFPVLDAEDNNNGLTVQQVRPGVRGEFEYLYYDDVNLAADFSDPLTQLQGDNTASGAHQWTSNGDGTGGGNALIVNTFSYGSIQTQIITKTHTYDCNPDYDGDTFTNDFDADDDDDGISDSEELNGLADPYGFDGASTTGYPRYLDYSLANWIDLDGNGISDLYDTDGDGVLNINDTDADGDGIFDAVEANDGVEPALAGYDASTGTFTGADTDSNGMKDAAEGVAGNGTTVLALTDFDADGVYDFRDVDSDNDGVMDLYEGLTNTDGDAEPDYKDLDSDGDGFYDLVEVGGTDANSDGLVDTFTDANGNGLTDAYEELAGGVWLVPSDNDGDGVYNFLDLDSDNDGLTDQEEGFTDFDGDGVENAFDLDSDNDGIADVMEAGGTDADGDQKMDGPYNANGLASSVDPTTGGTALSPANTDGTGNADYLDADSDGDGLSDALEAGGTDADGDGQLDGSMGTNGLKQAIDPGSGGIARTLVDTDTDGTYDYQDTESDGDGFPDTLEGFDTDWDGTADQIATGTDTDGDGLDDAFDSDNGGTGSTLPDTDADGNPNFADRDDDGDGIFSETEGNGYTQGGGVTPDYLYNVSYDYYQPNGNATRLGTHDYRLTDDLTGQRSAVWSKTPIPSDDPFLLTATVNFGNDNTGGEGIAFVLQTNAAGTSALGGSNRNLGYGGLANALAIEMDTRKNGTNDPVTYDHVAVTLDGDETTHYATAGMLAGDADITDGADHTLQILCYPTASILQVTIDGVTVINATYDIRTYFGSGVDVIWGFTASTSNGRSNEQTVTNINMVTSTDSDSDGELDIYDLDSDNDGLTDTEEGFGDDPSGDANGDGIPNYRDRYYPGFVDVNTDGINDKHDNDLDGVPNFLDLDSDNDGVADIVEAGGTDADGDGRADGFTDGNGDGQDDTIAASPLANADTDSDGVENFVDLDSDNDGLTDTYEAGGTDADSDGIIDGLSINADGWDATTAATNLADTDTDGDGVANRFDADSDNDGIPDPIEHGANDANKDGQVDAFIDTNGNGLGDYLEPSGGTPLTIVDSDGDGYVNHLDLDSDNDGIPDLVEAGGSDYDQNGLTDSFNDTDANGVHDSYESSPLEIADYDSDGLANFLDGDSDNDGLTDVTETSGETADADRDGRLDAYAAGTDTNANGFYDAFEYSAATTDDKDGDGVLNYLDIDSDNDGIPDVREIGGTPDASGRISGFTDSNNDGMHDTANFAFVNTDGDALPDHLDVDSDNDGLTDAIENGFTDKNGDGWVDSFSDNSPANADGYHDALNPLQFNDTNGDGEADYVDRDSDGDGLYDWMEAFDANSNGESLDDYISAGNNYAIYNGDNYYPTDAGNDTDGNGIPNWLEDDNADGMANFQDPTSPYYFDTDQNGLVNLYDVAAGGVYYDPDSAPDANGDGVPDWADSGSATPLPVELISFHGKLEDGTIVLEWETASEMNNSHFEIERLNEEGEYVTIGRVEGNGTRKTYSYYQFIDEVPASGKNFYRLKQVDFDGAFEHSKVVEVFKPVIFEANLFPMPFQSELTIELVQEKVQQLNLSLIDLQGNTLWLDQIQTTDVQEAIMIKLPAHLPGGIYLLRIAGETHWKTYRVMKR